DGAPAAVAPVAVVPAAVVVAALEGLAVDLVVALVAALVAALEAAGLGGAGGQGQPEQARRQRQDQVTHRILLSLDDSRGGRVGAGQVFRVSRPCRPLARRTPRGQGLALQKGARPAGAEAPARRAGV